jgi:hypothetical protein
VKNLIDRKTELSAPMIQKQTKTKGKNRQTKIKERLPPPPIENLINSEQMNKIHVGLRLFLGSFTIW